MVIVTSKNEDRVTVADTIRKLYAKRSALIHGGKRAEIHLSDVVTIQHFAEAAYLKVILNVPPDTPAMELLQELDKATYGTPWPRSTRSTDGASAHGTASYA